MMQEKDLLQMLEPIKTYIKNNEVVPDDGPEIVQRFFPTDNEIKRISAFLQLNLPAYRSLNEEKINARTREVIKKALEDSADQLISEKNSKFRMDEVEEELGEYEWDEETDIDYYDE